MRMWKASEARAKLCEVVRRAAAGEPQCVTRRGKEAVVFISVAEFHRLGGHSALPGKFPKLRKKSR